MWILLGAIIIIVSVGGLASLRNPTKLIDRIKGLIAPEEPEERAKKIIMKFGMAMAMITGIWIYMNTWGNRSLWEYAFWDTTKCRRVDL